MTPRDFALIAQEAYIAKPDIGIADSASRAIVRHTEAGLVVAFRGSDDVSSWLHDLDALTTDVVGVGPIHAGFWDAYQDIATDVLAAINGQPVTLVGHSLGSAIALCAAIEMKISGNPPAAVYAFEPPCISPDASLQAFLAGINIYATRNGNDIVTQVPPGWPQSVALKRIGHPVWPFDNVADHMMDRVISALAEPICKAP